MEAEEPHIINELSRLFPRGNTTHTKHPDWVKVQTFVYKKGTFVLLKYAFMDPIFGKIIDIVKQSYFLYKCIHPIFLNLITIVLFLKVHQI